MLSSLSIATHTKMFQTLDRQLSSIAGQIEHQEPILAELRHAYPIWNKSAVHCLLKTRETIMASSWDRLDRRRWCVRLLYDLAATMGITYEEILFVIIGPLLIASICHSSGKPGIQDIFKMIIQPNKALVSINAAGNSGQHLLSAFNHQLVRLGITPKALKRRRAL